ncbi:MAG: hypothetical protein ABL907_08080 [Hyphomicrobium sp.]
MLLLRAESQILIVGENLHSALCTMVSRYQGQSFVYAPSFAAAVDRLRLDLSVRAQFKPTVSQLDHEDLSPRRSTSRISISSSDVMQRAGHKPLSRLVSVVIIAAQAPNEEIAQQLKTLADYSVQRLVVCGAIWSQTEILDLLNFGCAESVVLAGSPDYFEKFNSTALSLKKRYEQRQTSDLLPLLANGATSFLNDAAVWGLIDAASDTATELRLSFDPPGVAFISDGHNGAFLMICDDSYLRALHEIAAIEDAGGNDPPPLADPKGFSRIGEWNYKKADITECGINYNRVSDPV